MNAWEEKYVHGEATLDEAVESMEAEFMAAAKEAG
jgi:hypothetical protein